MKINEVINAAKSRFSMLLTGDNEIRSFLFQSLTAYQDMAGVIRTIEIRELSEGGVIATPSHFLAHCMCKDATGDYVAVTILENESGETVIRVDDEAIFPLEYSFFVYIAGLANNPDANIPNRCAGLIIDHLECLIAMDNDDRMARVEASAKMDVSRIPSRSERIEQKERLETSFRLNREIIPMMSIHAY